MEQDSSQHEPVLSSPVNNHESQVKGRRQDRRRRLKQISPQAVLILGALLLLFASVFLFLFDTPEIRLTIEKGPIFSEETGLYEYIVVAQVVGYPQPRISFNRDDSGGLAGEGKSLIALAAGSSYELEALAYNRYGQNFARLNLGFPIEEEESGEDPDFPAEEESEWIIAGIHVPDDLMFSGSMYTLSADYTPSDGTTCRWAITDPDQMVHHYEGNPLVWTAPDMGGVYTIEVIIENEKKETATFGQNATVNPILRLPVSDEWSGTVFEQVSAVHGNYVFIGDDALNRTARGFITFYMDVSIPYDFTVHQATLRLPHPVIHGNPSIFHRSGMGLWLAGSHWGERQPEIRDWDAASQPVTSVTDYDMEIDSHRWTSDETMAKMIEDRLKRGDAVIQFRLQFARDTSNQNGVMDGVEYDLSQAVLEIQLVLNI